MSISYQSCLTSGALIPTSQNYNCTCTILKYHVWNMSERIVSYAETIASPYTRPYKGLVKQLCPKQQRLLPYSHEVILKCVSTYENISKAVCYIERIWSVRAGIYAFEICDHMGRLDKPERNKGVPAKCIIQQSRQPFQRLRLYRALINIAHNDNIYSPNYFTVSFRSYT